MSGSFPQPQMHLRYPPVLTIQQAAEMLQVPVGTLRDWRSRGLLGSCCRRRGKHLRFLRDQLIDWFFNGLGD